MTRLFVLLLAATIAPAASIWTYTFTDWAPGVDVSAPIGFSFSVDQPLVIAAPDGLVVPATDLACTVPTGDACRFAELWWQAPGDLRVLFAYAAAPAPPDDADFLIPSLGAEGLYGYRATEQATFTIHDPPLVTPEPGLRWLLLTMSLMVLGFRWRLLSYEPAITSPARASDG
jgi:hypothetical protein